MRENNPFIYRLQHNAIGNFNQQLREDASVVTHAASPRAFLGGSAGAVTLPHNGRVIRTLISPKAGLLLLLALREKKGGREEEITLFRGGRGPLLLPLYSRADGRTDAPSVWPASSDRHFPHCRRNLCSKKKIVI